MQCFGERNVAVCLPPHLRAQRAGNRDGDRGARASDESVLAAARPLPSVAQDVSVAAGKGNKALAGISGRESLTQPIMAGTPPASLWRGLRVLAVVLLLRCLLGSCSGGVTSLWPRLLLLRL